MTRHLILILVLLVNQAGSYSNNIQVSNVQLVGQNTATNTYQVQFDLSWENSWRTSTLESNWDAAWVFIKFSKLDVDVWNHARLNMSGGVASSGATLQVVDNADAPGIGVGAFIYRSADGIGNVNFTGIQLQWNYNGTDILDSDLVEVCVQAIEMVYVPQGAFFLGDGVIDSHAGLEAGITGQPYQVTSETTDITLGGGTIGSLGNNNSYGTVNGGADDFFDGVTAVLPSSYPIGFHAFYCMRYEISQGQYASFLNHLTTTQANARNTGNYGNYQHTIRLNGSEYYADSPSRASNYLNWPDVAAYLDWAALRPMSETEFEKAARGTRTPIKGEYAWGNTSYRSSGLLVSADPSEQVIVTNMIRNTGHGVFNETVPNAPDPGPVRCGILAASLPDPTREESGAGYFGAMELSGNVSEYCVSIGRSQGRAFNGSHGDGSLTTGGLANGDTWPSSTTAAGTGLRGGAWSYSREYMLIRNRTYINAWQMGRSGELGGRGVRTAP
jgi:formylglycine-generating enzyme required for sulfatase activity